MLVRQPPDTFFDLLGKDMRRCENIFAPSSKLLLTSHDLFKFL
jgi:hypothetical protein